MIECAHEWDDAECYCLINPDGSGVLMREAERHPGLFCEKCRTFVDLAHEDDPREV